MWAVATHLVLPSLLMWAVATHLVLPSLLMWTVATHLVLTLFINVGSGYTPSVNPLY